jgi:hypothetical protein
MERKACGRQLIWGNEQILIKYFMIFVCFRGLILIRSANVTLFYKKSLKYHDI